MSGELFLNKSSSITISYTCTCMITTHFFCSSETEALVHNYEDQVKRFMESTTVNQFKELFPKPATSSKQSVGKVTVALKLQNKWGDSTVDALTQLARNLGVLHLTKIEHGCIATLWLCSVGDVQVLKNTVAISTEMLQINGVFDVRVGDEVMLHYPKGI